MDNQNEFQTSVADVIGEDITTGARLFTLRTLVNSSIKEEVASKEIKGGYGSKLLYTFNYDKQITAELEEAQLKDTFIALLNGTEIATKMKDFWIWEEKQIVASGKITLNETPVGMVVVETDEAYYEIDSVGSKSVSVPFTDGTQITCSYRYNTSVETFNIDGDKFPKVIKVTYISKICTNNGVKKIMQITIPRFKLDGKFDMNLQHDGVSTSKMSGKAQDYQGTYATVMVKRVDGTSVPIQDIAVSEQDIALNSTTATSKILNNMTIGVRGEPYSNVYVPLSDLTLTSSAPGVAKINATTKAIEYVGAGTAIVTVALTDSPLVKDIISVTCTV